MWLCIDFEDDLCVRMQIRRIQLKYLQTNATYTTNDIYAYAFDNNYDVLHRMRLKVLRSYHACVHLLFVALFAIKLIERTYGEKQNFFLLTELEKNRRETRCTRTYIMEKALFVYFVDCMNS